MVSKRFKKLPENSNKLNSDVIEKLLSEVKKNCTTKFDESIDLNFQINNLLNPIETQETNCVDGILMHSVLNYLL